MITETKIDTNVKRKYQSLEKYNHKLHYRNKNSKINNP
jgi:predicted DNA-binding protein YlxM (UPF0122 family)